MAARREEEEYDEDEDFEDDEMDVGDVIDEVMEHPRVRKTFSLLTETLDRFGQLIDKVSQRVPNGTPPPRGAQSRPPQDARKAINPYLVMGFQPSQHLTADLIKARRKTLATIYHPDHQGGDPAAMAMVNAAADMLLKKLQ